MHHFVSFANPAFELFAVLLEINRLPRRPALQAVRATLATIASGRLASAPVVGDLRAFENERTVCDRQDQ